MTTRVHQVDHAEALRSVSAEISVAVAAIEGDDFEMLRDDIVSTLLSVRGRVMGLREQFLNDQQLLRSKAA